MPKVIFQIEGASEVAVECGVGSNLLEVARLANVAIDAPCSGNGSCGKCRVKLVDGELDSIQTRHISDEEYAAGWRLSCSNRNCSVCGHADTRKPPLSEKQLLIIADLQLSRKSFLTGNPANRRTSPGIFHCAQSCVLGRFQR